MQRVRTRWGLLVPVVLALGCEEIATYGGGEVHVEFGAGGDIAATITVAGASKENLDFRSSTWTGGDGDIVSKVHVRNDDDETEGMGGIAF